MNENILTTSEQAIALCADSRAIDFYGQRFEPDDTKGFIRAKMSHAFPVQNAYGQGLMPAVVAMSYKSLLHQGANYEHAVGAYDKVKHPYDKFIGSVVAVHFPNTPIGSFKVAKNAADSPGVEFIIAYSKLAAAMPKVVSRHLTARHKYSVSMEVRYPIDKSGFAVELNGRKAKWDSPHDLVDAGWEYRSWEDAPEELRDCFSIVKNAITKPYQKRKVVHLLGGLNNRVHYCGVGVVQYGAEREAHIMEMAASDTDATVARILSPLAGLVDGLIKGMKPNATTKAASPEGDSEPEDEEDRSIKIDPKDLLTVNRIERAKKISRVTGEPIETCLKAIKMDESTRSEIDRDKDSEEDSEDSEK